MRRGWVLVALLALIVLVLNDLNARVSQPQTHFEWRAILEKYGTGPVASSSDMEILAAVVPSPSRRTINLADRLERLARGAAQDGQMIARVGRGDTDSQLGILMPRARSKTGAYARMLQRGFTRKETQNLADDPQSTHAHMPWTRFRTSDYAEDIDAGKPDIASLSEIGVPERRDWGIAVDVTNPAPLSRTQARFDDDDSGPAVLPLSHMSNGASVRKAQLSVPARSGSDHATDLVYMPHEATPAAPLPAREEPLSVPAKSGSDDDIAAVQAALNVRSHNEAVEREQYRGRFPWGLDHRNRLFASHTAMSDYAPDAMTTAGVVGDTLQSRTEARTEAKTGHLSGEGSKVFENAMAAYKHA